MTGVASSEPKSNGEDGGVVAPPRSSAAQRHKWVVRTADADEVAATTRLATSWPLLRMYAIRQFNLRYRQSWLGIAWTVVQPIVLVGIYGFVFYQILGADTGDLPLLSVLWSGITVWMYVQAGIQMGSISLLNDAWLLGRVWFPREIIPLAPVVSSLIDLAVAGGILLLVVVAQGGTLSVHLLATPLLLALLVVWVAAISLITATITIFFRDMATIVSLALRGLFLATPVMYTAWTIPPEYSWLNQVNPFAVVVNNFRAVLLLHAWPNWALVALQGAVGCVLFVLGLKYLRSVERRMVDIV